MKIDLKWIFFLGKPSFFKKLRLIFNVLVQFNKISMRHYIIYTSFIYVCIYMYAIMTYCKLLKFLLLICYDIFRRRTRY